MPIVGTNVFAGLRPGVASHLLPDANASACNNLYLTDGYLRPMTGTSPEGSFASAPGTIYKWEDGTKWLSWTQRVHVARSINTATDRIYFTGTDVPRVGNVSNAPGGIFAGGTPYPNNTFKLGVPAPGTAPQIRTITEQPDESRDYTVLDLETRFYAYTMVNIWDEESARSPLSASLDCYDDSTVAVTMFAPNTNGYQTFKSFRLYRTNTGTQATDFQFVGEYLIENDGDEVTDAVLSAYLAEVAETLLWAVPPSDLQFLTEVAGRFYAGADGREACFSEELVPYAWPLAYRVPLQDPIVGVASNGGDVVFVTRNRPVIFVGNSPAAMQKIDVPDPQPCMSERSITVMDGLVIYASPDGLIGISSAAGVNNLTEKMLTRDQWLALSPETMRITPWERLLLITSDAGNFLFDIAGQSYSPIDIGFDAAYYDGYSDTLFITQGTSLLAFGAGTALTYAWRGKSNLMPGTNMVCARVNALTYNDLYFEAYVDDERILRLQMTDSEPFRLPPIRGRVLELRLEGTDVVRSVSAATTMTELLM